MSTVIVSGALANKPRNGGNAWSRLAWVLGFRRLGFEVVFVEQIAPDTCVDAQGAATTFESSVNLEFFRATMSEFGLLDRCALICGDGDQLFGLSLNRLKVLSRESCLLFNLSGHLTHGEILVSAPCRVYYDDDPGYTQFWHASGEDAPRCANHNFYFTLGANIGSPCCCIPSANIPWRHTRPPVPLEHWPRMKPGSFDRFTTVASWRGAYAPASFGGKTYGLKVHEFRKFLALPRRTHRSFEIALQIHAGDQKDLDALRNAGWQVVNPLQATPSPTTFRQYVQTSGAEFSVAQGIYVETASGWFSDRTVRYLASGRPALVQDTGLSPHYPLGQGLLTFRAMEEAEEGVQRIIKDYPLHCRAARRIAESFFDATRVVADLLEEIGVSRP